MKIAIALIIGIGIFLLVKFGLGVKNLVDNLRLSIGEVKPSASLTGLRLNITMNADNPTDQAITIDKLDLIGAFNGRSLGSTAPGIIGTTIAPNATTQLPIIYNIPLLDVTTILMGGRDVYRDIVSGKPITEILAGIKLDFTGSVTAAKITTPLKFSYSFA